MIRLREERFRRRYPLYEDLDIEEVQLDINKIDNQTPNDNPETSFKDEFEEPT